MEASVPSGAAPAGTADKVEGELAVSLLSLYYCKGIAYSRNSLVGQPSFTLSYRGLSLNLWGNLDTAPYLTPPSVSRKAVWNETDVNLSYSRAWGALQYGVGYSYYAYATPYEDADRPGDQQEGNAFVAFDVFLSPTLSVYKLFTNGQRWYFLLGLAHAFPLHPRVSLKLTVTTAYMIGEDAGNPQEVRYDADADATTEKYSNFLDGTATITLPVQIYDGLTLTPTVTYAFPLCRDAAQFMKGNGMAQTAAPNDRQSSYLFGGLVASWRF